MPSRRSHSKSRLGCVECKVRKVKVSHHIPSTQTCVSIQPIPSILTSSLIPPLSPSSSPRQIPIFRTGTNIQSDPNSPALQPTIFQLLGSILPSAADCPPTNLQGAQNIFQDGDLELLHHFSTSTYRTITNLPHLASIWQLDIPQMAFSNTFLMHGILAMAAFHFAHERPDAAEEYTNVAVYHHTSALSLYRPLLDHITENNCAPVVAFSTLVACLAVAMPQSSPDQQPLPAPRAVAAAYVKSMFKTLALVRGVNMIVICTRQWIKHTSIAPLVNVDVEMAFNCPLDADVEGIMTSLETRIAEQAESEEMRDEYLSAVHRLRQCYPRGDWETIHQSMLMAWPVVVSDGFFMAMVEGRQIAIAILGIWGTILDLMRDVWWVSGKGRMLVDAAYELLPAGWEELFAWARKKVKPRMGVESVFDS
ncbi:hypothetical protein DL98DRAFT_468550 [Cadophora sp. DSE1049]|nr:hypothetical protein DL98DRAFT_468550 [Cadophora sp. DSE1049]